MQWETARHCHSALSLLSTNIRQSAQHTSTSAIKDSHTTFEYDDHENENESENKEENTTANKKRKPNPNPTTFPTANHEIQPALIESSNFQDYENPAPPPPPPGPIQEPTINPPHDPIADTNPAYSQEMDNNHHLLFFPDGSRRSTDMGMGMGMGMGNFDLSMVDMLHGSSADFDSLFDMFGQQFPSF